jgi:CRP/FNR family transcriptional regulator
MVDSKNDSKIHVIQGFQTNCQSCGLNSLCLPVTLSASETEEVDQILKRSRPYRKNQMIYSPGENFVSIFAVRAGSVKVYNIDSSGDEHVIGFYFPGEIFGLNAIDEGHHVSFAKTLETTALCEIPFSKLESIAEELPNLQTRIYRLLSREIREDQQLQMLISKRSVEERLGTFILTLSERYRRRKLSPDSFGLPMSRRDIGNYLGVAVETISRVFSKLQRDNILIVEKKGVRILDKDALCGVAHRQEYKTG